MPNPDLDRRLSEFLEFAPHAKKDSDDRIDRLKDAVHTLTSEQQLTAQKLDAHSILVNERFAGVHARLGKLEEDVEDTGIHNIETIKTKALDATKSRYRLMAYIVAAAGAIALLLLGGAGSVIWYLITKQPPPLK